jgi:hypothetical protein
MPGNNMSSEVFNSENSKMREMELTLEQNDDILDCIRLTMKENNIHKANVTAFEGPVLSLSVNYFENSSLKNVKYFEPHKITRGLGELKYDFIKDSIFGRVRINYIHKEKTFDGILMTGKASDGFKIVLTYLESKE